MADRKISARTAASALTGAETVPVIQSGSDKKTTTQDIANLEAANKDTDGTLAANSDTKYPSQKAIKTYVDARSIITVKVSLSSAEILALNTTPKTLIAAPGAGKIIQPIIYLWVYTYGTVTYATNTNADVYYTGSLVLTGTTILNRTASTIQRQGTASVTAASFLVASQDITNKALMLNVQTGDPTAGDGTLAVHVSYLIITL